MKTLKQQQTRPTAKHNVTILCCFVTNLQYVVAHGYTKSDIWLVSLQLTPHMAAALAIFPISTMTSIRQLEVGTVLWTMWIANIANIAIFYGNGSDITIF